VRYFATAIPGLGPILARELGTLAGVEVDPQRQFDGRNDVVAFAVKRPDGLLGLRTSEDVFVEVASAGRAGLRASVRGLCDARALERALSVYAGIVRPLRAGMTFRVIARVLGEREFQRSALRDALTRAIQQIRPRWRVADPAALELWALETHAGRIRMGVRLTTSALRHRDGRNLERPGALRPTVAAAMVLLVGPPASSTATATLLDPCCGSGTILAEAAAAGWVSIGADLDPAAVALAGGNLGGTGTGRLLVADARHLPLAAHSVAAIAANLPFGKQYAVPGSAAAWFAATLAEFTRVTPAGAAVALLAPPTTAFHRALAAQPGLTVEGRFDLRLLGMATTLWQLRRRPRRPPLVGTPTPPRER
jgi:23S rRNA G2445 N2-methylase RlmL